MSQPRHRANKRTKEWPRVQPAGRHAGPPAESEFDRNVAASAAQPNAFRDLMRDVFTVPQHIREMGRR